MNDKLIGRKPVLEALRAGNSIDKILIKKEARGFLVDIIKKAKEAKIPISEVDKRKLDQIAGGENHQGVIAYLAMEKYANVEDILENARQKNKPPFIIILDKITDPHNLGSIIRTANCVGADGVIIPKHESAGLNEIVAKTSCGAISYTKVAKVTNISSTIDKLKKEGLWVVGADMNGQTMYDIDMTGAIALVIGNEGVGISQNVRSKCDFIAEIPMFGEIESLNASVAAGVLMYEYKRQMIMKK